MNKKFILLFFISLFVNALHAQIKNKGIPYIKNYTPSEMSSYPENMVVRQDSRGIMYFGNIKGLLEFDGSTWHTFPLPNKSIIWALDIHENGKIFIGAQDELGYFSPDNNGCLTYTSLLPKLSFERRIKIDNIWYVYVLKDRVIFQSSRAIYTYKDDKITIVDSEEKITSSVCVNDKVFISTTNGLYRFTDKLEMLHNGNLSDKMVVSNMIPYETNKIMLIDKHKGCFIYDGSISKWQSPVNEFLFKNELRSAKKLNEDYYAFGTIQNGVIITDKEGVIVQHLNKAKGLQNNSIYSIFTDKRGGLWLGLSYGADYVEINSPLSVFNDKTSVPGIPFATSYNDNKLYLGTNQGVYYKNWDKYQSPLDSSTEFRRVKNSTAQIWSLTNIKGTVFGGRHEGSFAIENNKSSDISKQEQVWVHTEIKGYPEYLLQGAFDGMYILKKKDGVWGVKHKVKGWSNSTRFIMEDGERTFWICHFYKGLFKLKLNPTLDSVVSVKKYGKSSGFPSNVFIRVFKINNELVFGGEKGLYRYDKQKDRFVEHELFNKIFDKESQVYLKQDPWKKIWFVCGETVGVMRLETNGNYVIDNASFKKLNGKLLKSLELFELFQFIDEKNIVIGTIDNFVHYDQTIFKNYKNPFFSYIRKVENISSHDSVIFGGVFTDEKGRLSVEQSEEQIIKLPYKLNAVRFHYSAAFYEDFQKTEYKYILKGFDKQWSDWGTKRSKDYTNLPEGKYTFCVKAKNMYDTESNITSYSFRISPPWYRSWWAYLCYAFMVTGGIYALMQLSSKKLKQRNERLEHMIETRTKQVRNQKNEIEIKNKELLSKRKEITDSINYSKRIQEAILPSTKEIQEALPDSFVLYRPKDIVSGDFYWFHSSGGSPTILIAAADCTGHGVPGAFMSMLGVEKLNDAAKTGMKPAEMLHMVNRSMKKTLHQNGGDSSDITRDGMDIALCAINTENRIINFAGANRPLWIARNGKLEEIKSNKVAIAGLTDESQSFTNHTVKFEKGDTLYIFTDGYADQFGGKKGKKLMTKKFKDILLNINGLPLNEQEKYLANFFDDWKGELEQVDDILVIGVRL